MNEYQPIIEKYRDKIQKMRILDDDFMKAVFDDNIEGTQDVLRIILDKKDLIVESVQVQRELKNLQGRSVRLDVFATDSSGKRYNIEIQRASKGAVAQRARHNQSIIDTNILDAGQEPEDLPEVFVIFVTEKDILKQNLPIYHIERIIQETGELFHDGEHIIYVNGAYHGDDTTELETLISDFRQVDPNKISTASLSRRVRYLKESEEGVSHMCRIVEEIVEKERKEALEQGLERGEKKEFLKTVQSMYDNHFSLEQMLAIYNGRKDEVIKALQELGLRIPQ